MGRRIFWMLLAVGSAAGGYVWWDHARNAAAESLEDDLGAKAANVAPVPATPLKARLNLDLKAGDVFPLVKTVTETIEQQTGKGVVRSWTQVEFTLAIRVNAVAEGRKRLRVDYRRVRYRQDLAGEKLDFDTDDPPRAIPDAVQPYRGLVGNGFDFWIGPDNRIQQVEDFEGFLRRCVAHVPAAGRAAVMTRFIETTGDDRVANFIDDSIGLLPYEKEPVQEGHTWKRARRVQRPVPLSLTQTCTLNKLNERFADVGITGEIFPSTAVGPSDQPAHGLQLIVTGGRTEGSCRIRRKTGLPEHSQIRRTYDMIVRFPNGRRFAQTKKVTTEIRVYTQQGAPKSIRFASAKRSARGKR